MDKEKLKDYYPNDEIREEFLKLVMLKNEDFWISPEEDNAKLLNTERKISYNKGKEDGIDQGSDEKTIVVIKNAIVQNIPIETIASLVGLSVEKVKSIIKEQHFNKDKN